MPEAHGLYRLREGVRIQRDLVYRTDPLAVTKVNRSALSVIDELSSEQFRPVKEIAHAAEVGIEDAESLLRSLSERGFLAWNPESDPGYEPAVSIIVTVRNEVQSITQLLNALSRLDYPEYEVVLIDDGSTDGTRESIRSHPLADSAILRLVTVGSDTDPLGIGASRNRGVEKAKNGVIAFTDADCRPEPDWLSNLVPDLSKYDVVGGRIRPIEDGRLIQEYESFHSSLDMGPRATPVKRDSTTPYLPTANLVGHTAVFEKHPFPERNVAEDVAVSWEALSSGFGLVYNPEGLVKHDFGDFANFLRRRLTYGASESLLAKMYGHPGSVPVPLVSALGAILLLAWMISGPFQAYGVPITGLLMGSILLGFLVDPAGQSVTALRKTPIRPTQVGLGFIRSSVSRIYGFTKEITRYYSISLVIFGVITGLLGYTQLALLLIGFSVLSVGFSLMTDLIVQQPQKFVGYSMLYLSDHLAYQMGAYRGAVCEQSLTHLSPLNRFDLLN